MQIGFAIRTLIFGSRNYVIRYLIRDGLKLVLIVAVVTSPKPGT